MKNRVLNYAAILLIVSGVVAGCINVKATTQVESKPDKEGLGATSAYMVQAVLWQQNAAEYKALCHQAFNLAKLRLNEFLSTHESDRKKLAIITDIDETVMDNSPYQARLVKTHKTYSSQGWADWVNREAADEVPGAAAFLNYADDKNVEIFYVSNRSKGQEEATIANMKTLDFPFADKGHLLFKDTTSSKKPRFERVKKDYTIVLYMGDNLSDFSSKFRKPSTEKRNNLAEKTSREFGKKFIVLPNPMYGDWDTKGIYKGKHQWSEKQRDSLRKASLITY